MVLGLSIFPAVWVVLPLAAALGRLQRAARTSGIENYAYAGDDAELAGAVAAHAALHAAVRAGVGAARAAPRGRAEPADPVHRPLPHGDLRAVRRLRGRDRHPHDLPVQPAVRAGEQRAAASSACPSRAGWRTRTRRWSSSRSCRCGAPAAFTTVHLPRRAAGHPRRRSSRPPASTARTGGRSFWHVVVPQLAPVTVFVAIWQTIQALQLFDLVYTTTRGGPLRRDPDDRLLPLERRVPAARSSATARRSPTALFVVTLLVTDRVVTVAQRRAERGPSDDRAPPTPIRRADDPRPASAPPRGCRSARGTCCCCRSAFLFAAAVRADVPRRRSRRPRTSTGSRTPFIPTTLTTRRVRPAVRDLARCCGGSRTRSIVSASRSSRTWCSARSPATASPGCASRAGRSGFFGDRRDDHDPDRSC